MPDQQSFHAAHFDLATARLVLVNVPQPEQIVAEAVALVRPGGWVAFHEADWIAHICDPPSEAWTAIVQLLVRYTQKTGSICLSDANFPTCCDRQGLPTFA
jgi:hypothetical protein